MKVKTGILRKDTYLYFFADSIADELKPLLDNKIISWHSYLLQRVKLPKGSTVIASKNTLYVICADGATVSVFKLNDHFFFKVSTNGKETFPRLIILPNGPPPPYPLSLLS